MLDFIGMPGMSEIQSGRDVVNKWLTAWGIDTMLTRRVEVILDVNGLAELRVWRFGDDRMLEPPPEIYALRIK